MEESRLPAEEISYDRVLQPSVRSSSSIHCPPCGGPGQLVRIPPATRMECARAGARSRRHFVEQGSLLHNRHDMSSRDIEGKPALPPAGKVYDRSCAIGPAILVSE